MDCRGEERSGGLALTLIVLVWNLLATAWPLVQGPPRTEPPPMPFLPTSSPTAAAVESRASGIPAPEGSGLTVRQKFLLGKRVDINRATREEIAGLPGISERTAGAVVEERLRTGGFRRPDDLLGVKGIKKKRLKKILPFLTGFHNN